MTLHAPTVARLLGAAIALLVLASTTVQVLAIRTGKDTMYGLVPFLMLDAEGNLPTWFTSGLLLFAAALLGLIAQAEPTGGAARRQWLGLSAIFVFLSADEASSIHEKFIRPVREMLGIDQGAHFVWILPFGVLLAVVAVLFARWFFGLPPRTRGLTAAAAALYVGAAMGLEGASAFADSRFSMQYRTLAVIEETLEMCGALLWIYALIDYGATRRIRVEVRLTS